MAFLLALVSGALLPLAFAPFHFSVLAFICPAVLLYVWAEAKPKRAFLTGFLFGLGFFGVGAYWVYISIHTFGEAPMPLALLITVLFISFLALFPAIQGYLLTRFFSRTRRLLVFPASWVLLEIARAHFLTGFPWLLLGYSQIGHRIQSIAPVLGAYGVSFFVVVLSSFLVGLLQTALKRRAGEKLKPTWGWRSIITIAFVSYILFRLFFEGFHHLRWVESVGARVRVSLIQGNIPQSVKWRPLQVQETVAIYDQLTKAHWGSDLIVWPEAAITVTQNDAKSYLEQLDAQAKVHNASIILGLPIVQRKNGKDYYYNGLVVLGKGEGQYLKKHLVPFGEFFPFRGILGWVFDRINIPMSDMSQGADDQGPLKVDGFEIAPSICYEIAYSSLVAKDLPRAQLLVTLTDDSWFGNSIAQAQHLQIAQMRALEVGRYLLMSTNDGVTAIINHRGKIIAQAKPFERTVLTGKVRLKKGATFFVRWGMYPVALLLLLSILLGVVFEIRSRKGSIQG